MQITPIGWLLIPVGLILWIVSPRGLYYAAIFAAPFSATAVINVGSGESASGVQAYLYFSILLILRGLLGVVMRLKVRIPQSIRSPLTYLAVFVFICAVSILMPLWIGGRLQIMSPVLLDMTTTPLRFSSVNVTGLIYLALGACMTAIVAKRTLDEEEFRRTVKVYTLSGLFVSLWGAMQLVCHLLNIPYPAFIFNTSATPSAQGYGGMLEASRLERISSVAVEPSLFAACLLTIVPFALVALCGRGFIVSRRADKFVFGAILFALLLSTSSTAYVGLILLLLLSVRYLMKFKGLRVKYVLMILAVPLGLLFAFVVAAPVRLLLQSALFSKAEGYSALERSKSIVYAFSYFQQYPVLGVGWSSVTSHDTVVKLLSNCGLAGLLAFLAFVVSVIRPLNRRLRALAVRDKVKAFDSPALILLIVVLVTLAIAVIDGFPYVFGHFWIVLGLAISAAVLHRDGDFLFSKASGR